jgi:hypothetical protein
MEITTFAGERPKIQPTSLEGNQAQLSENTFFTSGGLDPLKSNVVIDIGYTGIKSLFDFEDSDILVSSTGNYSFANSPVIDDTHNRIYYTDNTNGGIYVAKKDEIVFNTPTVLNGRSLGVEPSTDSVNVVNDTSTPEPTDPTTYDDVTNFIITFTTDLGEESPPSYPSEQVYFSNGDTITINDIPVSANQNVVKRNIYIEYEGDYYFIKSVDNNTDTSISFELNTNNIQYILSSGDYDTPPSGIKGLTALPNGVFAGYFDNNLIFSEPYQPHAFPIIYRKKIRHNIKAIKPIYNGLVVLTDGEPSVFIGSLPVNMTESKINSTQSCINSNVLEYEGNVIYISNDGLMLVGQSITNITENIFSREQWQGLNPTTMKLGVYESKVIVVYDSNKILVIDLKTATLTRTELSNTIETLHYQLKDDRLLLVVGDELISFNQGNNLTFKWQSKKFIKPQAITINSARIEADSYPVVFRFHSESKTFTKTVNDNQVFRVGDRWRKRSFSVELEADKRINAVYIHSSAEGVE